MADDRPHGRLAVATGQERDRHGRFASVPRGVAGTLYDPERRQLYRLWRPEDPAHRLPSGTTIRVDRGALYLPVLRADLGAIQPVTPRAFALGLAALADWALSWMSACGFADLVPAFMRSYGFNRFDIAVILYLCFWAWFGCTRIAVWLWPPPEPPITSFETIDEIAERRGWKKPRNTRFDDELSREDTDDAS